MKAKTKPSRIDIAGSSGTLPMKAKTKPSAHSHHAKNTGKAKPRLKPLYLVLIAGILVAIVVIIFGLRHDGDSAARTPKPIAATVNGEAILVSEIESQWQILPDEFKAQVTREMILQQTVEKVLILQQAEQQGITVSDTEVDIFVREFLSQLGLDEGMIEEQLKTRGLTMGDIKRMYREQLIMVKLINSTVIPRIVVTDKEIEEFYHLNQEFFGTLEESRDQISDILLERKQPAALQSYIDALREGAEIVIKEDFKEEVPIAPESPVGLATFIDTGQPFCTEGGKPVVYLFSTTWCPHCTWIADTFEAAVMPYVESGDIVAYHWELDINDDRLTDEVETQVPSAHLEIYSEYNPRGTIPTFVFGCRYYRIGNGYEQEGSLQKEAAEFKSLIESMI